MTAIAELEENRTVEGIYAVARKERLRTKGGSAYLARHAENNPSAFMALVGRVLPLQVKDGVADPVVPTVVHHICER